VRNKGKWKIVNHMEEEKSCKFWADPLAEQVVTAIQPKRQQRDKHIMQRQRDKKRIKEVEKELHELREQLQREQELHQQEKEAQKQQTQQGVNHVQIDEEATM